MKIEFPNQQKSELLEEAKKWFFVCKKKLEGFFAKNNFLAAFNKLGSKELGSRTLYGFLLTLASILFIFTASALPHLFRLACAVFALWQLKELRQMSPFASLPKRLWVVIEAGIVVFLIWGPISQLFCAALVMALCATSAIYYGYNISQLSLALFAFIYFALPLGSILQLNELSGVWRPSQRQGWLIAALLIPKIYDIGAYFTGKALGKNLLAPELSPNKTVEGVFGGAAFSTLALAVLQGFCALFSSQQLLLSFLAVPLLAQFGDLFESWIKRSAGARHSGVIPGLGGVMDLSDAITWCAPYFLYLSLGGFR